MVEPRIIPRPEHNVSRSDIDDDVLRILYRLKHHDYEAYLVGGAIRDLLRGVQPKDFDICTNATPAELRRLFRNSRIIGKRFRLVHVFFGPKNVEVATLRCNVPQDEDEDDLYVDDDNEFGDVESDAFRRDFTVNSLFYNIYDFSIIDYTGGVDDLRAGIIRSIGDPETRFGEDPVRILRAIKFAARFGYRIENDTERAMRRLPDELLKASRFRITEEIFRILTQANRDAGLKMLADYGVLRVLYPTWLEAIGPEGLEQVQEFFSYVEREARDGRYLPLEVVAAGLLLPLLDTVDVHSDQYHQRSAELVSEVRQLGDQMDLPKRLMTAVTTLLRGQLYMLFFAHRKANVRRFVRRPEFDWVWRLHDLAFGHIKALHGIQELWLTARESNGIPVDGWVDSPDQRDVFSFRGATGGGRRKEDEPVTVLTDDRPRSGPRKRRRRRY